SRMGPTLLSHDAGALTAARCCCKQDWPPQPPTTMWTQTQVPSELGWHRYPPSSFSESGDRDASAEATVMGGTDPIRRKPSRHQSSLLRTLKSTDQFTETFTVG